MVEPYRTGRPLGKNCAADRELSSIAARHSRQLEIPTLRRVIKNPDGSSTIF